MRCDANRRRDARRFTPQRLARLPENVALLVTPQRTIVLTADRTLCLRLRIRKQPLPILLSLYLLHT